MDNALVRKLRIPFGQEVDEQLLKGFVGDGEHSTIESVPPISVSKTGSHGVRIEVSPLALEHLYFHQDGSGVTISRDPRLLNDSAEAVDSEAIYSHLQFGMMVPPRSPWRSVRRFIPGSVYDLDTSTHCLSCAPSGSGFLFESDEQDEDAMCHRFRRELDGVLQEICPAGDPVILFSGGVDSALLASRAVALGWTGTTLVNYCLGEEDEESRFAEKMAAHLGLEFVRVDDDGSLDRDSLSTVASKYPSPFGDYSVLPTNRLTTAVQDRFASRPVVLDGTGADASFGLFSKARACKRFYRMPNSIRRGLAAVYPVERIWTQPSRVEFFLRMCRRTQQMNPAPAAIARNPLHGVLYQFPSDVVGAVNDDIASWLDGLGIPADLTVRLPLIDLVLGTSNIFAQKNASLFHSANQRIAYPFMDPRIALLAVSNSHWMHANRQPKAILKKLLATEIPDSMVYRTKHGFTVPGRIYFSKPEYVDLFNEAMASELLLSDEWSVRSKIDIVSHRLLRQIEMPAHNYHFVWNVVFLYLWLLHAKGTSASAHGARIRSAD